jgi:hypothetical protein
MAQVRSAIPHLHSRNDDRRLHMNLLTMPLTTHANTIAQHSAVADTMRTRLKTRLTSGNYLERLEFRRLNRPRPCPTICSHCTAPMKHGRLQTHVYAGDLARYSTIRTLLSIINTHRCVLVGTMPGTKRSSKRPRVEEGAVATIARDGINTIGMSCSECTKIERCECARMLIAIVHRRQIRLSMKSGKPLTRYVVCMHFFRLRPARFQDLTYAISGFSVIRNHCIACCYHLHHPVNLLRVLLVHHHRFNRAAKCRKSNDQHHAFLALLGFTFITYQPCGTISLSSAGP